MEYLLVKFCEVRGVIVDGIKQGVTNQVIELETGTHSIALDKPFDYTPEMREIVLRRTSVDSPKVVTFEKI